MEKIASFCVDHNKLKPGLYVSRKDLFKDLVITTFDLRFTRPNYEPVIDTAALHTIEHLGATFLRNNDEIKRDIIYFGPMGCRTGFYLIVNGNLMPQTIYPVVKKMIDYIINYEGDIPGASSIECGNYLDLNLSMAKYYARKYLNEVLNDFSFKHYTYPKTDE